MNALTRTAFRACLALSFAALASRPTAAADAESLPERIRDAAAAVRGLETLYTTGTDPAERSAALQAILARAAWLEQVGGLKHARGEALLALAQWEKLGRPAPLNYGFLAEPSGAPIAEAAARRPRPGELPAALEKFEPRLLYLLVRNTSSRPLTLVAAPFVEGPRGADPIGTRSGADLPPELRPFAALFAWPARLAAGEGFQSILLLPENAAVAAAGVELRADEWGEGFPRALRVVFAGAADPDGLAQARRESARRESAWREEQERERRASRPPMMDPRARTPVAPAPRPPVATPARPAPPAEKLPAVVGAVDRSGTDQIVQVRLTPGVVLSPGQVLLVRKGGAWCGRVRMPEEVLQDRDRSIFWATILEGTREELGGGTLHLEK